MSAFTRQKTMTVCGGQEAPRSQSRRLPIELLIAIADQLCSEKDFVAFGMTCNDLYALLIKKQRPSLEIKFEGSSAMIEVSKYRLLNQQAAVLRVSCPEDDDDCLTWRRNLRKVCRPKKNGTLGDQSFVEHVCKLAKGIRELTISGFHPYPHIPGYTMNSHPLIQSCSFKAIQPKVLRVETGWVNWDFQVLQGMSMSNLRVLKLPICLPEDCASLGQALSTIPRLVSLAITDIPDREEFLAGLEFIGKGIMSCATTLRELDLEMTNFNRPADWGEDERFIEPEENGFFFHKLFHCPSDEELFTFCKQYRQHSKDMMVEAPLNLTKLRLKHISLPWYSFGTIFNAKSIKNLHLPYSMVDNRLWEHLAVFARLDTLTEISYDMLSTAFLRFLSQQSSLKELTFARPQDQYHVTNFVLWGDSPQMIFDVSKEAPRLGPDAGAGYPSLDEFLFSLKEMKMLKHLLLPADMYGITKSCLVFIGASLTGLEHLEMGFDYNDSELRGVFAFDILCSISTLKKVTFLSLRQPRPLLDFDSAHLHAFIVSLEGRIPANLKFLRYITLDQAQGHQVDVYYHRQTKAKGKWWMLLPPDECEVVFAEGRTPSIVPVGKWDWEIKMEPRKRGSGKARKRKN